MIKINKMAVNFIWGTREATKRELLYQSQKEGSLGAMDLGLKLKILQKHLYWVKKVKKAIWTGEIQLDQNDRPGINPIF